MFEDEIREFIMSEVLRIIKNELDIRIVGGCNGNLIHVCVDLMHRGNILKSTSTVIPIFKD